MTIPLRAVLWDLDGTLVDSEPLWRRAEEQFLDARGHSWSDALHERLVGGNLELVSAIFEEVTGVSYPVSLLKEEMSGLVLAALRDAVPWAPGVDELVRTFDALGVVQGIVTSSYRDVAETVALAYPVTLTGPIVARDDVVNPKPHPEPYLTALAQLDTSVGVLAIEDSASGSTAARAANLPVLRVSTASTDDPVTVSDFTRCRGSELVSLLGRLGFRGSSTLLF